MSRWWFMNIHVFSMFLITFYLIVGGLGMKHNLCIVKMLSVIFQSFSASLFIYIILFPHPLFAIHFPGGRTCLKLMQVRGILFQRLLAFVSSLYNFVIDVGRSNISMGLETCCLVPCIISDDDSSAKNLMR